jgi:hypothetical protein
LFAGSCPRIGFSWERFQKCDEKMALLGMMFCWPALPFFALYNRWRDR